MNSKSFSLSFFRSSSSLSLSLPGQLFCRHCWIPAALTQETVGKGGGERSMHPSTWGITWSWGTACPAEYSWSLQKTSRTGAREVARRSSEGTVRSTGKTNHGLLAELRGLGVQMTHVKKRTRTTRRTPPKSTITGPKKNFRPKNFSDPKYFLELTFFWTQNFFGTRFFLDPKFFFRAKIFLRPKVKKNPIK